MPDCAKLVITVIFDESPSSITPNPPNVASGSIETSFILILCPPLLITVPLGYSICRLNTSAPSVIESSFTLIGNDVVP